MNNQERTSIIIHHFSAFHANKSMKEFFQMSTNGSAQNKSNVNPVQEYFEFLTRDPKKPDVIVVCGSISCFGAKEEFNLAAEFFAKIFKLLSETPPALIIIPGPLDVSWNQIQPNTPRNESQYDEFKLFVDTLVKNIGVKSIITPFSELPYLFIEDKQILIYALDSINLSGAIYNEMQIERILELFKGAENADSHELSFNEINEAISSYTINPKHTGEAQLNEIDRILDDFLQQPSVIKIAVMHHNLTGYHPPNSSFSNIPNNSGHIKQGLIRNGVGIILHGDNHTCNIIQETDLIKKTSFHFIGSGALMSSGNNNSFNQIEIGLSDRIVSVTPLYWKEKFSPGDNKKISFHITPAPLKFINNLLPDQLTSLDEFIEKIEGLTGSPILEIKQIDAILTVLRAGVYDNAGIDEVFLNELKVTMNDERYDKLYFTDTLGADVWLNPEFTVHLAQQIWHYTKKNSHIVSKGKGRSKKQWIEWRLRFDDQLNKAIKHCYVSYEKLIDELLDLGSKLDKDRLIKEGQFNWVLTDEIEAKEKEPPLYQIARILIWPEEDLYGKRAEALIQLHKIVHIPLFYISQDKISNCELKENRRYEYHIFVSKAGDQFEGYYYDNHVNDGRHKIQDSSIPSKESALDPGLGNPLRNFQELLKCQHIYLAEHYRRYLIYKKEVTKS